ncbi:MAG TPA: DNA polymerase, partial [Candidatus Binatus sp.]|nr:DNA polymerase [Candidatus Binatus sp.]
ELHGTPKQKDRNRSKALEIAAIRAYYGGRFEVTTVGKIEGPIHEYDINSAYPAAMLELPCPVHTKWKRLQRGQNFERGGTFVCRVTFRHSDDCPLCSLPIRRKGRLFWPRVGEGWYWSHEIAAAIRAGTEITAWKGGYYAEKCCDCLSHEWVRELYTLRKSLGKAEAGYPIKLGINGLYGKYAQRLGAAPWRDYIAAGIITAITRAKLIDAYAADPSAIVYLATDALFSRRPLAVEIGDQLGQWETKTRDNGLFLVQPGIYWTPGGDDLPKTRGIPRSKVIEAKAEFEAAWSDWIVRADAAPPVVTVPVKTFVGHRQAIAWGRPEQAGSWITLGNGGRDISFKWDAKRDGTRWNIVGQAIRTYPRAGGSDYVSEPYDPAQLTELHDAMLVEEAAEDYRPWGNSGE